MSQLRYSVMEASTEGCEEQGSTRQQGGKDKSFQGCCRVSTVLTQDHRRSLDSTEASHPSTGQVGHNPESFRFPGRECGVMSREQAFLPAGLEASLASHIFLIYNFGIITPQCITVHLKWDLISNPWCHLSSLLILPASHRLIRTSP